MSQDNRVNIVVSRLFLVETHKSALSRNRSDVDFLTRDLRCPKSVEQAQLGGWDSANFSSIKKMKEVRVVLSSRRFTSYCMLVDISVYSFFTSSYLIL